MAEAFIRVLTRAVTILDCFLDVDGSLGISELSRRTQLSKSTVHHVVSTLVETGLLAPDGPTRRYQLGPKVAQLGNAFIRSTDLRDLVLPLMTELRALTHETVTLHAKVGDERVIMAQVESTESIRRVLEVGLSRPLHLGAAGIVMMTDLEDQEILALLKRNRPRKLTSKTVTDPQQILKMVQKARVDGYCILNEQTEYDVGAIAFPIHDHRGLVPAALLVSGPIHRWNPKTIAPYIKRLKGIVESVSQRLGKRLDVAAQPSQIMRPARNSQESLQAVR